MSLPAQDNWPLLNTYLRDTVGASLDPVCRTALAVLLGVDLRTVQRWLTQATERLDYIPRSFWGVPYDELPLWVQNRVRVYVDLILPADKLTVPQYQVEVFHERFSTLLDLQRYLDALIEGTLDPYLQAAWLRLRARREGLIWILDVTYQRIDSDPDTIADFARLPWERGAPPCVWETSGGLG